MISKVKLHRFTRKLHRYMGVVVGIQFFLWTAGGLYFSWTNLASIRGEDLRLESKPLPLPNRTTALGYILDSLQRKQPGLSFENIQVVDILGKAYYQIKTYTPPEQVFLFDLESLQYRAPLSQQEAIAVAQKQLRQPSEPIRTAYITSTNGHHEYREKPLPAYGITFGEPNNTTVYVATQLGTVQSFRNSSWRIFDFLWMMHIMDYNNRDNINNYVLRIFSILGLFTIASGFMLYFFTIKTKRK